MSAHLSEQFLMEVLEGAGSPVEWAHVASCAECRSRLEEARAGLGLAARAGVPEPPGLYWEALRRNVSRRIAEEPARPSRRGWLVPLAATAAAVVVLVTLAGRSPEPSPSAPQLPAWSALPPVEEDDDLAAVRQFVEDGVSEWEEGQGLGAFVASLSDEESEALVAALSVGRPEGEL